MPMTTLIFTPPDEPEFDGFAPVFVLVDDANLTPAGRLKPGTRFEIFEASDDPMVYIFTVPGDEDFDVGLALADRGLIGVYRELFERIGLHHVD